MEKFQLKRPSTNCAFLAEAEDPRHTDGSQPPPNNCEEQDTIQVRSLPLQQNVLGIASDPTGDAEFHKGIRDSIQFNDTRTLKVLLSSSPTWLVDNFPLQLNSVEDLDLKLCERYQIYGPLSSEMHMFLEEEFGLQHLFVSMANLSRISTTENELLNTICASLETFKSYADRFLLKNRLTQHRTNLVFFLLVAKKYESWMHIRANQQKYITLTQQTLKKIQLTLTKLLASLHEYTTIFSARDKIRHSRLEILKDNEEPFHCWEIYQSGVEEMEEANIIYKTCRFGRLQRNLLDDLSRAFAEANVAPSTKTPNEAEASQSFSIMKDIYSLNRILHCIDLALSGVSKNESMHCINNLVVERALQVTGEYMKNTDETPNLSKEIQSKLTTAGVQLDLLAEVRNLLSHYSSKEFFSEIKSDDTDFSLVENVKNDLQKVRRVILKVIRNVKIKQIQNLLDVKGSIPDEKNDEVIKLVKHILGDIKRGMSQRNIKEALEKLINILEKHTNLIADVQMAIQEISCFLLSDIVQEKLHAQNTTLLEKFDNSRTYKPEKFGIFDHDWEKCKSVITAISSIKQIEQFRNAQITAKYSDTNCYGLTLADIFARVIMANALLQKEIKVAIKRMKFGFQTDLNAINLKNNISSGAYFLNALIKVMTGKFGDQLNSYLHAYLHDSNTCELFKLLQIAATWSKDFRDLLSNFRLQTVMMAKSPQVLDDILTQALENVSTLETNADEQSPNEVFKKIKSEVESKKAIHIARTKLLFLCDSMNIISKKEFSELVETLQCDVQEKDWDKFFNNRVSCKTFLEKVNDPYGKVFNEMKKGVYCNDMKTSFIEFAVKLRIHENVRNIFSNEIGDIIEQKFEKQFFDTLDIVRKVKQEIEKYVEKAPQRELITWKTNERLKAALEMAILKALNALEAVTTKRLYRKLEKMLHASAGYLLGNSSNYIQLRNYLAHGNVMVDMLNERMQDFLKAFADILVQNGQTIIAISNILTNKGNCSFLQTVLRNENLSHLVEQKSDIFGRDFCTIMESEYWRNLSWRSLLFNVLSLEENASNETAIKNISDDVVVNNFSYSEFLQLSTRELCTAVSYGDLCGTQFFLKHSKQHLSENHVHVNLLHQATGCKNLDVIQTLLREELDVNAMDEINYTPLHFAVLHRNMEAVRCLLANKANARAKDVNGYAPLHIAAFSGAVDIVALLNQHGANVREISKVGVTPLWLAALNGHAEVVEALLGARALVDMPEEYLSKLVCEAAANGHAAVVNALIGHGAKLDCCQENDRTLLHLATLHGHVDVVQLLVNLGANVNARDAHSMTPLHHAPIASIVETLVESGADVDSLSRYGTPLHIAAHRGAPEVVEVLLRKKASIEARTAAGILATHFAAANGNVDTMRLLVDAGASVNSKIPESTTTQQKVIKETPLHLACEFGNLDMVTLLLELKANGDDIIYENVPLSPGSDESEQVVKWPLKIAIENGHFDIACTLLEHGVSIGIMDEDNFTALHLAASFGNLNVVKKLLERGADVNAVASVNRDYATPVYLSVSSDSCQSCDILQLLIDHGADLSYKVKEATLLHYAVHCLKLNAVELLLKNGFNINAEGRRKKTALHYVCEKQIDDEKSAKIEASQKILRCLLDNKANVDAADRQNSTPLHLAAHIGNTYAVKTLLSYGADPHKLNDWKKSTFQEAESNDHIECCAILRTFENKSSNISMDAEQIISHKEAFETVIDHTKTSLKTEENWIANIYQAIVMSGDLNAVHQLLTDKTMSGVNVSNYHLLHLCLLTQKLDIMVELFAYGLDINHFNNEGLTPLHLATQTKNVDAVKRLLSFGADVNMVTESEKMAALHIAVQNKDINILQLLLDSGNAITDVRNIDNETPLMLACKTRRLDTVCAQDEQEEVQTVFVSKDIQTAITEILLAHGADVQAAGKMGNRPLHYCMSMDTMQISKMLIERGANVNCINNDNCTPLHIATQEGNEMAVDFLLKNDANVDGSEADVNTPLHLAVDRGLCTIVKSLIEKGANVNATNGQKQTPLHLAASKGNYEVVDCLLKNAADTEVKDFDKRTPLFLAVREVHHDVLQLLAANGACVNATCEDNWAIIHEAVQTCDVAIVDEVLRLGGQVNSVGKDGWTPLHLAIRKDLPNIVEVLLAHNAETNVRDCTHAYPIHIACETGHFEIVEMLVKAGAEVNCCNGKESTPLMTAVIGQHENCIQVLIKYNAAIHFVSSQGKHYDALSVAVLNTNLAAVKMLIENGADIYHKSEYGSYMHQAAVYGSVEILEIFINRGLDVNECGINDMSPLHMAIEAGHAPCVRYLLAVGADIEATTKKELGTPLMYAINFRRTDIVDILIENGANVNKSDICDQLPLHYAAQHGFADIIRILLNNGADANHKNTEGATALHCAVGLGHMDAVKALLLHPNVMASVLLGHSSSNMDILTNVNNVKRGNEIFKMKEASACTNTLIDAIMVHDGTTRTPLLIAIFQRFHEIAIELIEMGANVHVPDENGNSPLMVSITENLSTVVNCLLKHGADVRVANNQLHTALHCAISESNLDVIHPLLENGANVNAINSCGQTPLHLTVIETVIANGNGLTVSKSKAFQSTAKSLILKGAEVNLVDWNYQTALHIAAEHGLTSFVALLLQSGAIVNGNVLVNTTTPLHLAASKGHVDIIRLLLENGACVDQQDDSGETALYNSTYEGHLEAAKTLIFYGANTLATNTPNPLLQIAVRNDSVSFIKLILENLPIETCLAEYLVNTSVEYDLTALSISAARGNFNTTELLLLMGADANGAADSEVPLIYAAHGGHKDILRLLFNYNCRLDKKDKYGSTALHVACEEGHLEVVEILLQKAKNDLEISIEKTSQREATLASWNTTPRSEKCVEPLTEIQIEQDSKSECSPQRQMSPPTNLLINTLNADHHTPLLTSIIQEHEDIAITLIEAGADVNVTSNSGLSPLMFTVAKRLPDVALSLMQHGADTNAVCEDIGALHFAINENDSEGIQLLKDHGANTDVRRKDGSTLLHHASCLDKPDVIPILLKFGLNINAINDNGKTCLHLACFCGHAGMVESLIEHGADGNAKDKHMRTPLFDVIHGKGNHTQDGVKMAELLLMAGTNINAPDENNWSALHCAAISGFGCLVSTLLDYGSDVNLRTKDESTALHLSTRLGHLEVVAMLLQHNASVTERNNHDSILHAATSCKNNKILQLILDKLKNESQFHDFLNARDKEGDTPLMWAAESGDLEAAKMLLQYGAMEVIVNNDGMSALDWAIRNKHADIVSLLTNCKK